MKVGVYLYPNVEMLDFTGAFSVFSCANRFLKENDEKFEVILFSRHGREIQTQYGLMVSNVHFMDEVNELDILVVPGGSGARVEYKNEQMQDFLQKSAEKVSWILSVCTGSLLLLSANLLTNQTITTHFSAFELAKEIDSTISIDKTSALVQNGKIITTAGVLTGIFGALKIVSMYCGETVAQRVKENLYYEECKL